MDEHISMIVMVWGVTDVVLVSWGSETFECSFVSGEGSNKEVMELHRGVLGVKGRAF
jgi:hypothetical protein